MKTIKPLLFVGLLFGLSACGGDIQVENYDIPSSTDILLTVRNHPHGYQKTECFLCHNISNIHQVWSSTKGDADPLIEANGINACGSCHGHNGN